MRVGVLTSGGDAPGMNAAIRGVTRAGVARGWEVFGVLDGYAGLLDGRSLRLDTRGVGGILQRGGTVLGSARCPRLREPAAQAEAVSQATRLGLDALIVIGGGGSQSGAHALAPQLLTVGIRVVGVASTIDNDLLGSDPTLGAETAVDVALESLDRLRVTAASHHRVFVVEVMGRDCGYLALVVGITGGAEVIVLPEHPGSAARIVLEIQAARRLGKSHTILVVSDGARPGVAEIGAWLDTHPELGLDHRVTRIGHVQRGGAPNTADRLLGTRLGAGAIEAIDDDAHDVLVGLCAGSLVRTPLSAVVGRTKALDPALLRLARLMMG